jgi:hypothetical protein
MKYAITDTIMHQPPIPTIYEIYLAADGACRRNRPSSSQGFKTSPGLERLFGKCLLANCNASSSERPTTGGPSVVPRKESILEKRAVIWPSCHCTLVSRQMTLRIDDLHDMGLLLY